MALMTVTIPGEHPGIARAAQVLGVAPEAMDQAFGVVPIDPARNLYAVQVREDALKGKQKKGKDFEGPFANPRIEPFGPTRR
jgi:hypothetical protein